MVRSDCVMHTYWTVSHKMLEFLAHRFTLCLPLRICKEWKVITIWDNIIWRFTYTIPWDTQRYNHIKHNITQDIHTSTAKLILLKSCFPPKTIGHAYRATLEFGFWLLLTFKIQEFSRFNMFIVQNTISVHGTFYRSKTMLLTNQITAIIQKTLQTWHYHFAIFARFARSSSSQLLNKAILQLQQSAYVTYLTLTVPVTTIDALWYFETG